MKRQRISSETRRKAKALRRSMSPAEQKLWYHLRARRFHGLKFRRQHPIEPYIVDFYCAKAGVVIEIDGDSHADATGHDQKRSAYLQQLGLRELRFANTQVRYQLGEVLRSIGIACRVTGLE